MDSLLIVGGRLIDPVNGVDARKDLLLAEGKVAAIGEAARELAPGNVRTVDAAGRVVSPGLTDCHVHFREPGQSAKENIAAGSAAAARGGFTSVVCMPNTQPAIDSAGTVALIQDKIERRSDINVLIVGAVTKGLEGKELAPIGSLSGAGVVAISDDDRCIQDNELMRRALEYAKMFELPVFDHCRDYCLVGEGVMHEGYWSMVLGLDGWPASGEEMIVARNIHLAGLTGTHIHCQNVSTAGSVELLREARRRELPVSGETCPHYFTLTDATIAGSESYWSKDGEAQRRRLPDAESVPNWPAYDTCFKTSPPLRSAQDRQAILTAVAEGVLEIVCSDHSPHCNYEKEVEFDAAPFGVTGLETELALSLEAFYHSGLLSLPRLIERFTVGPNRLLRHERGNLAVGQVADVIIFDPDERWEFDREKSLSKGKNSPFHGWSMRGRNKLTIVGGKIVWQDGTGS